MKFPALSLLAACIFASGLHAQDLAPELLPLAMKYRADTAALEAQKKEAQDRVRQLYAGALDAAEKTETSTNHLPAISAITQERADLTKGELATDYPGNLPKGLHTARKACLDGLEKVAADFEQRQQRIAGDYLRALSALQTRAGSNAELTRQVNGEKERVLNDATGSGKAALLGKWILTNAGGQFWRVLHPDGTMTCNNEPISKWRIVGGVVQFSYPNGVVEEFKLPVRNGKMTGKKNNGETVMAEKAKN